VPYGSPWHQVMQRIEENDGGLMASTQSIV
jgi:hypothetical protein